ncbi:MAG: hypothetical protein R3Y32_00005 [Bacillota bacterium]
MKTFDERYGDEILTDNSKIKTCEQCKDCRFQDDGTAWTNDYKKAYCSLYQYPQHKPMEVIHCTEECEFYEQIK